jgi:hypothetical protein
MPLTLPPVLSLASAHKKVGRTNFSAARVDETFWKEIVIG